jgi:hypothetical protein
MRFLAGERKRREEAVRPALVPPTFAATSSEADSDSAGYGV